MTMDPKYTAVKGSLGPEIRCVAYALGPMRPAHEAKKRMEPEDQLERGISHSGLLRGAHHSAWNVDGTVSKRS
jgi:hypothetical protein